MIVPGSPFGGGGAANKAIITLISSLDASLIASMPKDGRIVFIDLGAMGEIYHADRLMLEDLAAQAHSTLNCPKLGRSNARP